MRKISFAGFKDPVRRPRYIIWAGVAVLLIAAIMIPVLGVTSTRWFCAEGCHKVQDDTSSAYQRSSHAEVSCMACHMPVSANPVIFILHKAEALGELYLTVRDDYELPLNGESEVALTMSERQCTQCHNMTNRNVTPSSGIKIDHAVHSEINAACPVCHNRIAHNESGDWEPALTDPKSQEKSVKHANFMSMNACFRCHGLEKDAAAPGSCSACHPADFDLKPPSHKEKDFFPAKHGELAMEFKAEAEGAAAEGSEGGEKTQGEGAEQSKSGGLVEKAYAEEGTAPVGEGADVAGEGTESGAAEAPQEGAGEGAQASRAEVAEVIAAQRNNAAEDAHSIGEELPSVESVFYCSTCHTEQFCNNCHGMEVPHPAEFREPKDPKDPNGHPALSKTKADKCVMCHGKNEKTYFCDSCHHGAKAGGWTFKTEVPWTTKQHPQAVSANGVKACTTQCHTTKFCADCHTGRKVVPASHKSKTWTRPKAPGALTVYGKSPAKPSAGHSTSAQKSIESCAVCHGEGGPNAKFCKGCHKLEMPHPATFKENHVSAKKSAKQCQNCHLWKEVCSNCHHVDSSTSKPWIKQHGASVNKNTPAGCIEKCHTKDDCVKCHNARKVVPSSHRSKNFVRNFSKTKAQHVQLFTKDGEICTYCHKGDSGELQNGPFCKSCHKVQMPHPLEDGNRQKFPHAEQFRDKKLSKKTCSNCHKPAFCDSCHHEGSNPSKPWLRYHPNQVRKTGADPCFECHKPTFCANCHVNLAKRGLL